MFVWKEKRSFTAEIAKLRNSQCDAQGYNKRAIGLFPQPKDVAPTNVDLNSQIGFTNFLVQLEGHESTCVVRIISPKGKSRAAVLIFRGRVLGCLWGHDDDLSDQLMGKEAYDAILNEILHGNCLIDTWPVDDKTAIAAAAIFHGEVFQATSHMTSQEILNYALHNLLNSKLPGTIVLTEAEGDSAILFIFKGKIHGFYSFKHGYIDPESKEAKTLLTCNINTQVNASKLPCCNIWEMKPLTFSVTGLNDDGRKRRYTSASLNYKDLPTPENLRREGIKALLAKDASLARHLHTENKSSGNPWAEKRNPPSDHN